ncbi:hypothetical protein SEA_CEPENS_82 [Mycobacterium phage Cepens]|nr:hypothetical protein PBI_MEGABEAR_80 [Mycobacterium phage Megabear]QBP32742.1 hypothetical protein SEA_CEPENS_82 [Mycobacterium phage Cepens]
MMHSYTVTWEIDCANADDMLAAAEFAREAQMATGTTAVVFTVTDRDTGESAEVDLDREVECCRDCGRVTHVDDEPVDTDAADGEDGYCGNCADRLYEEVAAEDAGLEYDEHCVICAERRGGNG